MISDTSISSKNNFLLLKSQICGNINRLSEIGQNIKEIMFPCKLR